MPPTTRIEDIATFFASPRSFDGKVGRLLSPDEMTAQESAAREKLLQELTRLRSEALDSRSGSRPPTGIPGAAQERARSLNAGPYRFGDGQRIIIVCAWLPPEMLERMPYTDPMDPDFIELYRYSDLDALLELYGHLRATNPGSFVAFRAAGQLESNDYSGHLVSLGGVDWNEATSSAIERLQLPVKQVSRLLVKQVSGSEDDATGDACFEVKDKNGHSVIHRPRLDESRGRKILREDVALFARAISPYNRMRTVTICNGMYGRGTYGAVRALTDERFRDRNAEYLRENFGDSDAFCILSRVTVENGWALTPDWTLPETRLFEWSRSE
jgi:hypothetical protein